MANQNDGVSLGSADVIATEYLDANATGIRGRDVPTIAYEMPRSKIAVGAYGQDLGDACDASPLPTIDNSERRAWEAQSFATARSTMQVYQRYAFELIPGMDARGRDIETRGQR